jgi:hypothetical protein
MVMLSGCGTVNTGTDGTEPTTAQFSAELVEDSTEDNSEAEDEFSQDDFVLYADDKPVVWLGMTKDVYEEYSQTYNEYYQGITELDYNTQNRVEDGEATDETVDFISLITYMGGRDGLKTAKDIGCVGDWDADDSSVSTAEDVISAYGLDTENEKIYIGEPTDDNYTIAVFFNIDGNNRVTRTVVPNDSDIYINDIDEVRADYYIKFMITLDEVSGIQLYRRRAVDA